MKEFGLKLEKTLNSLSDVVIKNKTDNKIFIEKKIIKDTYSWIDFFDIFKKAKYNNGVRFVSFGTCTIDKSEQYTDIFNNIVNDLSAIHPGNKISVLSIIHFITRNNNDIYDENGNIFKKYFFETNPDKVPEIMPPKEAFEPTIHSDPVDGFFIQLEGSTLWKIYNDFNIEEHILTAGDLIFIPKGLRHSVESLCPRIGISISFLG